MIRIAGFIFFWFAAALSTDAALGLQTMRDINPDVQPPMRIDEKRVAAAGIRVVQGKHVTLYTDLPASEMIDGLPVVFDAAVPKWCAYFGVEVKTAEPWRLSGFVMRDKERFEKAGLIPDELPQFPAGLNRGHEFWVFVQPDEYYTRHLMIHEGTHAFMGWFCGGLGAPWYAEGMAELLGLHQWKDGQLTLPFRPTSKLQTSGWGRPKLIRDWIAENKNGKQRKTLGDVLNMPDRAFRDVENYAWGWAACEFLGRHPLAREKFSRLPEQAKLQPRKFNAMFKRIFDTTAEVLERDWTLFIRDMDYGADAARSALSELEASADGKFRLSANRSWQFLPTPVKKGEQFAVKASGRFTLRGGDAAAKAWRCEARGVSIEYFRGRKLGELQAFVVPDGGPDVVMAKLCQSDPIPVGPAKVVTADTDGLLCFRINESPAEMADNEGFLELAIEKVR